MKKFKIIASVIGPYLPISPLEIDKYKIYRIDTKITNAIPPKITATAINESMITISQEITFDTQYIIEWKIEASSSKVAQEVGNVELELLLAYLFLPASSYKYFASIVKIEHLNIQETNPDPESPASPPVHILSYEPKNLSDIDKRYYEKIIAINEPEIKDLLSKFYQGTKSEILSMGDSNLKYYKILEEVSHKTLKRLKKESKNSSPNYTNILKEAENLFRTTSTDQEKVSKIKEYANKLRALDYEQIGERILRAAELFKLKPEIIDVLKNINKYRAKVIAHPGKEDSEVKLQDHRDIREMARLFLLHYMNRFYSVSPPHFEPVKENDSWYRFNYSRSDNSEK